MAEGSMGDLGYRDRALRAEAKVVALEEELRVWRDHAAEKVAGEAVAAQLAYVSDLYRPHLRRGAPVLLTARLTLAFLARPGRVVTQAELVRRIGRRDEDDYECTNLVNVAVCYLRRALSPWGLSEAIETVWGQGYRLRADCAAAIATLCAEPAKSPENTETQQGAAA